MPASMQDTEPDDDGISALQEELSRAPKNYEDLQKELRRQEIESERQAMPKEARMVEEHEIEFEKEAAAGKRSNVEREAEKSGVEKFSDTIENRDVERDTKRQRTGNDAPEFAQASPQPERPQQSAAPRADERTNMPENPQTAESASDKKVLIPVDGDGKPMAKIEKGTKEVNFEQYDPNNEAHKNHVADKNAPVLIESNSGSMLSKNGTYHATSGKYAKDDATREANKAEAFGKEMEKLGVSKEVPDKEAANNYKNMPGLLVEENGKTKAVDAKQFESLDAAKEKYGKENVQIHTHGSSYQATDTYDRVHQQGKGADARFEQMKNGGPKQRDDLAEVYVRQDNGSYKSMDSLRAEGKEPANMKKEELLVQSPSGTLLTPKQYKSTHGKEGFEAAMEKNGIDPAEVKSPVRRNGEDVLVKTDKDTLELPKNVDKATLDSIDKKDVLVQNQGKRGPTGNYQDAERAEKYGSADKVAERLEAAGIERGDDKEASSRAADLMRDAAANQNSRDQGEKAMEVDAPAKANAANNLNSGLDQRSRDADRAGLGG